MRRLFVLLSMVTVVGPVFAGDVGQYQLVTGRFLVVAKGSSTYELNGVFKLDTKSGEAWVFAPYQEGDQQLLMWAPVQQSLKDALKSAKKEKPDADLGWRAPGK